MSRGAFKILSHPPPKAIRRKRGSRSNKIKGSSRTAKFAKSKNIHPTKALLEEEIIEEDLKADFEANTDFSLSEGEISPLTDCLHLKPLLNLSSEIPFPSLSSPPFKPTSLDLPLDQDAQNLLQNAMLEEEDQEAILDTPLAVLYSQIKEKRKLGIHQNQEGLGKPDFGSSPTNKGRKYFIDVRSLEGMVENQSKLLDLWKVGKGNPLPEQQ